MSIPQVSTSTLSILEELVNKVEGEIQPFMNVFLPRVVKVCGQLWVRLAVQKSVEVGNVCICIGS